MNYQNYAHSALIDWALTKGFNMSVTDASVDPEVEGWDVEHSTDKAEIMEACAATELPNVVIYWGREYLLTFSIILCNGPDECICDWTIPNAGEWRIAAEKEMAELVYNFGE